MSLTSAVRPVRVWWFAVGSVPAVVVAMLAFTPPAHGQTKISGEPTCCDHTANGITVRVCIPSGVDQTYVVQGLIVDGNGGTGDNISFARHRDYREFATHFRFGTVASGGVSGGQTYTTHAATFYAAFEACGTLMGHPELKNVPIVPMGCSSAGANAYGLAMYRPERTIAFASTCPAGINPSNPSAAQRAVPGIFMTGGSDTLVASYSAGVGPLMQRARPQGALWSAMEVQGMIHCGDPFYHLFLPFIEKVIRLRLPAAADPRNGPVALRAIAEDSGWLADDTTWNTGFTQIHSHADFPGDKRGARTSWILDADMAFLHRASSSRDPSATGSTTTFAGIAITSPDAPRVLGQMIYTKKYVGDTVEINGNAASYAGWERIELYQGSTKLAEVMGGGATFKFAPTITAAIPVAPAFHVIAYGAKGRRTSRLYEVAVRPAANAGTGGMAGGPGGAGGQPGATGGAGQGGNTGGAAGETGTGGVPDEGTGGVGGDGPIAGNDGSGAGGDAGGSGNGHGDGGGSGTTTSSSSGCAFAGRPPAGLGWFALLPVAWFLVRRRGA